MTSKNNILMYQNSNKNSTNLKGFSSILQSPSISKKNKELFHEFILGNTQSNNNFSKQIYSTSSQSYSQLNNFKSNKPSQDQSMKNYNNRNTYSQNRHRGILSPTSTSMNINSNFLTNNLKSPVNMNLSISDKYNPLLSFNKKEKEDDYFNQTNINKYDLKENSTLKDSLQITSLNFKKKNNLSIGGNKSSGLLTKNKNIVKTEERDSHRSNYNQNLGNNKLEIMSYNSNKNKDYMLSLDKKIDDSVVCVANSNFLNKIKNNNLDRFSPNPHTNAYNDLIYKPKSKVRNASSDSINDKGAFLKKVENLKNEIISISIKNDKNTFKDSRLPFMIFDWLYLGNSLNSQDLKYLQKNFFGAILNCALECPNSFPGKFEYKKLALCDTIRTNIKIYFDEVSDFIENIRKQNKKILIHCYMGRSRSVACIIAYMIKYKGYSFESAHSYIRSKKSDIGPNSGFISQLRLYEQELKNRKK